eukprot:1786754-Rhodomonas_salina.1
MSLISHGIYVVPRGGDVRLPGSRTFGSANPAVRTIHEEAQWEEDQWTATRQPTKGHFHSSVSSRFVVRAAESFPSLVPFPRQTRDQQERERGEGRTGGRGRDMMRSASERRHRSHFHGKTASRVPSEVPTQAP